MHNRVCAHPQHGRNFEALVRYMMRSPVSLTRLRVIPGGHDAAEAAEHERVDAEEFVARVLVNDERQRVSSRGTAQARLRSLSHLRRSGQR